MLGAGVALFGLGFILLLITIGIVASVFWIVEIIDCVRRQFANDTIKIVWVIVICCSHVVGALVYYFAGKPMGTLPGQRYY